MKIFLVYRTILCALITIVLTVSGTLSGCGPKPPIPYQQLQIQDSSEAEGFDIYMYIAVKKDIASGDVEALLKWFRDVKFPDQNRIKIFVWNNPQSALINVTGDMIATLYVDREKGIDDIQTFVRYN